MHAFSDPDDFHGVVGTLSFTRNVTESCVTISVVDDSVRESVPECFTVSLVNVTGADLEDPSITTVCIEDNDGNCCMDGIHLALCSAS